MTDTIASHFSNTRYKPWPKIEGFLQKLPPGSIVADIGTKTHASSCGPVSASHTCGRNDVAGCGNGKYLGVNKAVTTIGLDRSIGLARIAAERGFNVSDVPSHKEGVVPALNLDVFLWPGWACRHACCATAKWLRRCSAFHCRAAPHIDRGTPSAGIEGACSSGTTRRPHRCLRECSQMARRGAIWR